MLIAHKTDHKDILKLRYGSICQDKKATLIHSMSNIAKTLRISKRAVYDTLMHDVLKLVADKHGDIVPIDIVSKMEERVSRMNKIEVTMNQLADKAKLTE